MKVVVGTPSLTGQVQAEYVESLVETIRIGSKSGLEIYPILLSYESVLPQARNEIFKIAFGAEADALVFIDADMAWSPSAFLKVVQAEQDVIGLPYPKKSDQPAFESNLIWDSLELSGDLLKVRATGTGFLKLSRNALTQLWENSQSLLFRGKILKNVFEYATPQPLIDDSTNCPEDALAFMGEDIHLCAKLTALGFNIWVDTSSTCHHIGTKSWYYNFSDFVKMVQNNLNTSS